MFKDSFYNFFSSQISRLAEYLPSTEFAKNQESIHIVRVCLKKTKTILIFIENLEIPNFSFKKNFKLEKQLFDILGKIRELYNQHLLLLENEQKLSLHLTEYENYLKKKLQKEHSKIKSINTTQIIIELKSIQQQLFKIMEMYDDHFLYDEAILFINKEFLKITKIKNNLNDYKDWHKMRKHIKNIIYIMTIISNSHSCSEISSDFIDELDSLQDNIGIWHDDIISFEHLATYIEKNKNINSDKLKDYQKFLQHLS